MAELKEEHFLRIDENKDRILQSEKKKLQHQVLDLEMTLLKIKEVIRCLLYTSPSPRDRG